ncbi:MAG: 2-oxoglutarate dehydrogenase complex dihydrolipoyllysine-residue succinyltransferase, partial [Sphingobacteriales bacterium]
AKMIRESGVEINSGSGKSGRITKADILAAIKNPKQKLKTQPETQNPITDSASSGKPETGFTKPGTRSERREQMSSLRKAVSKHLVTAKNQTAMLTTFNEVDMKPIMDIRNQFKDTFKEKHGVNLGFMSFFAKAVCNALQEFPAVNASLDGDEIIYHDYCDISIAVSTPKGLVVPVIRNAESLSMVEIEMKVAELAKKGRDNKLSLEEMTGGTFTISNGGVFGSLMSTPIINIPQVAILGMHKIQERPIALNGQVVIRPMMYLALSYDHRMIDGKESVTFLVRIKEQLENPSHLLFGQDLMKYLLDL